MNRLEIRYADYSLTQEQEAVRESFAEFFARECPPERVRAAEPLGHDARLWRQLAGMGISSMALPESVGGDGGDLSDLVIVAEQAGGALAPVPLAEHIAALRALARYSQPEFLARAMTGERVLAVALGSDLIPGGAVARDVLAVDGDDLVLLHADEPPPLVPNQGSTPLARWDPATARRTVLSSGNEARACYATARAEWKLLTAAALVGLTQRALVIAVDFARTRETMGVPIGSLQGVSFPLTDVQIGVSGARNLVRQAAWRADNEADQQLIPAAFAYAARVATQGTTTAAHIQGGLGFTVEADASLYFLRAKGWSVLGGDPAADIMTIGKQLIRRISDGL